MSSDEYAAVADLGRTGSGVLSLPYITECYRAVRG